MTPGIIAEGPWCVALVDICVLQLRPPICTESDNHEAWSIRGRQVEGMELVPSMSNGQL